MKELSIEQKAKAYDKALERARYWEKNPTVWSSDDICQKLFPELKEPEDERIRKNLITYITTLKHPLFPETDRKESIAWLEKQSQTFTKKDVDDAYLKGVCDAKQELEKQGEQKSAEFKPLFRVGDVIKPKDPVLGEPRIIKGIHPKFGYDTNNGFLDFEFEDNWEAVEEPVSEDLEAFIKERVKNIPIVLRSGFHELCRQLIRDGAKWQKEKDESTTEDLGEYINELSKQFPEVSFAKLSRIAVRVAKWQREQMEIV